MNIADLRRAALRRLPRVVFDYVDGGADAENTLRANVSVFDEVLFRPRGAVVSPAPASRPRCSGSASRSPSCSRPVGSTRLLFPKGEVEAARAAGAAGDRLHPLHPGRHLAGGGEGGEHRDVLVPGVPCGGREVASAAIERARKAGYGALVVTVDTAISGLRERDYRNGIKELVAANPSPSCRYVWQFLSRPRWLLGYLADGGLMQLPQRRPSRRANGLRGGGGRPGAVGGVLGGSRSGSGSCGRARSSSKGILTAEDARRAVDEGARRSWSPTTAAVSSTASSLRCAPCPRWWRRCAERIEVLMDGGIRRGSDIVKALVLGARAVLVGRAYAYGLGAAASRRGDPCNRDPHRRPPPAP